MSPGEEGAPAGKVLGVLGTFVLDRIVGVAGVDSEEESLGGIAYALAAAAVAAPPGWTVLPVARVGVDAAPRVRRWLGHAGLETTGLVETPEANNRVELRYGGEQERTERLTGGVGGWPWEELAPRVARCDALLVNFISGFELSLEDARRLRKAFRGPVYADLHSLFLDLADDGTRVPRALPEWRAWTRCFDAIQLNEPELDRMAGDLDREAVAQVALTLGPGLMVCTRGDAGALCWTSGDGPRPFRHGSGSLSTDDETLRRYEIPTEPVPDADPTGCGDVFGGALCCDLLAGVAVDEAVRRANGLAAVAAARSGADGLLDDLRQHWEMA